MSFSHIGVIFDCDGTLLDSMTAWREVETQLASQAGSSLTRADSDLLTTLTIPEASAFFYEKVGLGDSIEHAHSLIDQAMLVYYQTRACERPGALAFVQALAQQGVSLSVASSSPQSYLQAGLARAGFMPYLQTVVSVDDVGASKREPAVFDRARTLMGTPLETTWGFEDSAYALEALRDAGYRRAGIFDCDLSGTYEELAARADFAILSFEDLSVDEFLAWNHCEVQRF